MRATQSLGGGLIGQIPRHFIRDGEINRRAMYEELVTNGLLREMETREIEEALTKVSRRDLVAVADLRAAGLVTNLRNIGVTSFEFERVSPVGEASQSMSILDLGNRDLVKFSLTAIPVPVTASQFSLDARQAAAGGLDGTRGEPISITNVEEHTRAVAEKLEDSLVNGSPIKMGGNGMPGYCNFGSREQVSFSDTAWSTISGAPGAAITDVIAMRSAARGNGFTGPYNLYIPSNFDGILDDDYKANSDRTLRERLLAIDGITNIKVLPSLPDSNVLLVQMTRSVVQAAVGQDISTITWDLMGGLQSNWAILAVMGFALKVSWAREPLSAGVLPALTEVSGIVHLS